MASLNHLVQVRSQKDIVKVLGHVGTALAVPELFRLLYRDPHDYTAGLVWDALERIAWRERMPIPVGGDQRTKNCE